MKSQIIKTILCVLIFIVLSGLFRYVNYQIDMYYAQVAAKQVVNDEAYAILQLRDAINAGFKWVFLLALTLILYFLYLIWRKKKQAQE